MSPTVALVVTFLLLLANAFFVASEFAIVKIRPTRVAELALKGSRKARILGGITTRLDAFLSANQLGITLCSIGIGWLGEPAIAQILRPWFASLGDWKETTIRGLSLGIGFSIITFFHTVIGELAPKSLALQRTEPVALWTAPLLKAFYYLAFPFIWVLNGASNLFIRMIGLRPTSEAELLHTPHELRMVLQHARLDPGARHLIDRVFDYTRRVARHVMTERNDVVVLTTARNFDENLQTALANQYTRYPLVQAETGRVIGYVHLKDIVAALASDRRPTRMRDIAREPIFCSEETPLEWLRREFQRRRVHLAIVLGERHRFSGIVTLEDTLEEFVGEIQDEQDLGEQAPMVRTGQEDFEVDARLTLDVVARDIGLVLTPHNSEIETLGAYIEAALVDPPFPGDAIEAPGFHLTVLEVRDAKIKRVSIERIIEPEPVVAPD